MELICTANPDTKQKAEIRVLEQLCHSHDGISLTFPLENNSFCFLLYDKGCLLSAMAAFFSEENLMECTAFTHPSHRNKGYFTMLLETLEKKQPDADFLFPSDKNCPDTVHTMDALGAKLWYEEYMMAEQLADLPESAITITAQACDIRILADPEEENLCYFLMDGSIIGQYRYIAELPRIYFYGFEVEETLRGRGLGTLCFRAFLKKAKQDSPAAEAVLQVSSDNDPALSIYKKAGFRITEALSYYLY